MTPCPAWCRDPFHPWEPDADEFDRFHRSHNLASPGADYTLELHQIDAWYHGTLEVGRPCLVLNDQPLSVEATEILAADIAGALR